MRTSLLKNLIITLFFGLCTSCIDKDAEQTILSVSTPHDLQFAASNNADAVIDVNTNSDSWEYTAPEWVIASKTENSLIVNVTDNEGEMRNDSIIFTAYDATPVVVAISQSAHIASATLNNLMQEDRHDIATDRWSGIFNVTLSSPVGNDVMVTLSLNPKHTHFDLTGNICPVIPEEAVSFTQQEVFITQGNTQSDSITITVDATLLTPNITYVVPIYGAVSSGNAECSSPDNKIIYLIQRKGERTVKQIVYLEVNNCNPLNILEYNLADGTPFFDAVILFAANINYDSDRDVVYLHNNPNVQALLDNSAAYLQPLRERGIKVYLGILGNHDAAGLAQLSNWGAEQWAQSVAETCYTYKLDGVNLDDEYSKNPLVDNHWFTQRSAKAGARLAYELKNALRNKCDWPTEVSVFEFGALYDLPAVTVDGQTHTQSEFIDIVLANYGGYVTPYGDLTYAQCSGASIELAQQRNLTERAAQNIINKGYGWCMWFAFDPSGTGGAKNNLEHSMQQFNVAAEMFYNSQVMPPVHVYNKIGEGIFDPTPHLIK
ncbi:MAG: DUF1735 domain-containing protein [Bacteroidaceae bacterium]|nr:DUF1735 domain-containing protein [Bacteroidaceae bacterium]